MFQVIRVVEAEMARVKKLNQVGKSPNPGQEVLESHSSPTLMQSPFYARRQETRLMRANFLTSLSE